MADTGPKNEGLNGMLGRTAGKKTGTRAKDSGENQAIAGKKTNNSKSLSKVLRIGIIQSGKIIEERILRKRKTVSIGLSEKNTFIIVSNELPGRFDIFENKNGQEYILQFTEAMTGRVSVDGEVKELSELKISKKAKKKGKVYQLLLSEESRGKIVVGDSSILFQFVIPPPIQPRPQLPATAKGSVLKQGNWSMIGVYTASLLLHVGVVGYLRLKDWPAKSNWEKYIEYHDLVVTTDESFKKKKEKKVEDGEGEGDKEKEDEQDKDKNRQDKTKGKEKDEVPQKSAEEIARERAERRADLVEQLAQRGINKILGSIGGSGEGAIVDVLRGGDVGGDQDELLAQVSGVGVATGEGGTLRGPAGGKGSGEAADISQLKMEGGDANIKTGGAGTEREVKGEVKRRDPSAVDGTGVLNPQEVAKVVNRRIGSIKGCYERALRRDPTLGGKITIRFTIAGSGKVTSAKTTLNELTPEVGDCIVNAFVSFRFPQPEGGDITVEYPFMFTPAN